MARSARSFFIRAMSALRRRSAPSMRSRIAGKAETSKDEEDMGQRWGLFEQANLGGLTPLLGFHHLHRQLLPLVQSAQPRPLDDGDVQEDILSSILTNHEAKAFVGIEPLDGTFNLDSVRRIGAPRAIGRRPPRGSHGWTRRGGGTRVDRKNRRDLTAFLPLPDLHAELGLRIDYVVPRRLQHGNVEKSVAGAVGQLNESETLVLSEPLDNGINGRAAWSGVPTRRSLGRALRTLFSPRRWSIKIIVEAAASRPPVSSFSH